MSVHLSLFVAGFLLGSAVNAQTIARAERPQIHVGDQWTYEVIEPPGETKRQYTVRVREVTPETIITGGAKDGSKYDRHWVLLERRSGGNLSYRGDPARLFLQFPLEVGKTWNGNFNGIYADGWVLRMRSARAWVESFGKVTVPAGTFDSFLVKFEGHYAWRTGNNVRYVESTWYSPDVRRWVKTEWEWTSSGNGGFFGEKRLDQLVSFKPADDKAPQ